MVSAPSLSSVRAFSFFGANLVPIKVCEHFRYAVQKFFFAILHSEREVSAVPMRYFEQYVSIFVFRS